MQVKVQTVLEGKVPTQAYKGDVAHDTYIREDVVVVGGSLSATKIPLGIKTSFDDSKYAMLLSPRGSFSKLPITQANTIGIVEGNYRGEYLGLVRANLLGGGLSDKLLSLDKNGDTVTVDIKAVPVDALKKAKELFLKDNKHMVELLNGRDLPSDVLENLFVTKVPLGTVYLPKGVRLFQAWAVEKQDIEWEEVNTLEESNRGTSAVGQSGMR